MEKKPYISEYLYPGNTLEAYTSIGGFSGMKKALTMSPSELTRVVIDSGLRGRGGAGFPTGRKWSFVTGGSERYIVCNADEGEPGTFKDRFIMERAPYLLLEGLLIAGYAVGAQKGYIYIRGEYPKIASELETALETLRDHGYLGEDILGSGFSFSVEIKKGGGSYVVGDETALLSSLMGNRGYPLLKPPYPTENGLWGKPTVINNVETLAYVPIIVSQGAQAFRDIGTPDSSGPKLFSVSGHVQHPGIYEFPLGTRVAELLEAAGGMHGRFKAVQIGGTAGPVYDEKAMDARLDYESLRARGGALGSGALVFMNTTVPAVHVLEITARFFAEESCGQCFPCRYGTRQLAYMAGRIARGNGKLEYLDLIQDLVATMYATSFCPFGQSVRLPVMTLLENFGDEIRSFMKQQHYIREVV